MTDFLEELIRAATTVDGQPPFSDQSLIELRTGARRLMIVGDPSHPSGAALVSPDDEVAEAELVVHPDARGRGLGAQLLRDVLGRAEGTMLIWAHGDHPAARALAAKHGLEAVRELLQLRAEVVAGSARPSTGSGSAAAVRAFRPGRDDAAWLRLNAKAFADHPEQGKLTQRDLDARMAEPWFTADDFLLLEDAAGQLAGFCWLKVSPGSDQPGEFYAVGVDPERQGEGLGRVLVAAGLRRLAERGIREASLYVEADNVAAVKLYRSFGFDDYAVDIQYRKNPAGPQQPRVR